jgi:hypothetical protein
MEFLKLAPSAGFEKGVGFANEFVPIRDAHGDGTCVDVVESLMKSPILRCVIDYERAVDRNCFGLNGREIGSEYGSVGMSMSKLDGPCW